MHTTQPCRIYLHPAVLTNPALVEAISFRTGLSVVVGDNPAAPSLVKHRTISFSTPQQRGRSAFDLFKRGELLTNTAKDPGNGGWIHPDPDPFNGGGRAA